MEFAYNFISTDPNAVVLEKMILLRQTEKFITSIHRKKEIAGPCHLGIGQEAISVALSNFVNPQTDSVFASHRSHNPYLAVTLDVYGLLAELARVPSGCSGGRGGSTFLTNTEKGFVCSTPILTGGIGLATGAALAKKLDGTSGIAVVFFGDGAVEEGIFHEALNFSSVFSIPIFFVCENNLYSCNVGLDTRQPKRDIYTLAQVHGIESRQVDGNDYFTMHKVIKDLANNCRQEKRPVFLEAKTFRISSHTGTDNDRDIGVRRNPDEIEKWKQQDPIKRFLQSIKINDKDINADKCVAIEGNVDQFLKSLWKEIEQLPLPSTDNNHLDMVYAESRSFNTDSLPPIDCSKSYLESLQQGIDDVLSTDSSIYMIGQGVSSPWDSGKWVNHIYGSMKSSQITESPNSEAVTTAAAIGMALSGKRCIVNHPRMDFLLLAADPIINQGAKAFYMSGGKLKVPVVIRSQLYRGNCQGAQHSQALQSLFAHIPGLRVVMPATPSDARNLLYSSTFSDDPVLFIDDKWLHDWILHTEDHQIVPLKNEGPKVLVEGQHITLVGMGISTRLCYYAAKELTELGIQCEVIDLRILNPINCDLIINSCRKTKSLLVVDMSWSPCSVSSEILAQVSERLSNENFNVNLKRMNLPNHPAPASKKDENEYYISSKKIKSKVQIMLNRQQGI